MSSVVVIRPRPSCAHCGMPIPTCKPGNTRYCRPTCRVEASKARRSPSQPATPHARPSRPDTPADAPAQRQTYARLKLKIELWDQVKLGLLCLTWQPGWCGSLFTTHRGRQLPGQSPVEFALSVRFLRCRHIHYCGPALCAGPAVPCHADIEPASGPPPHLARHRAAKRTPASPR
jgi:hypothetical protein